MSSPVREREAKLHDAVRRLEDLEDDLRRAGLHDYRERLTDARADIADAELSRILEDEDEEELPARESEAGGLRDLLELLGSLSDPNAPRELRIRAALVVAVLAAVVVAFVGGWI